MTYPGQWTPLDPALRIEAHSTDSMYGVLVTHLPTGIQEYCGEYPHVVQNKTIAIARLKTRVPDA